MILLERQMNQSHSCNVDSSSKESSYGYTSIKDNENVSAHFGSINQ
jgi:hypothetical protein